MHLYNLDALKLHASLPPPPGHRAWPPVAATRSAPTACWRWPRGTTPSSPTTPSAPRWLLGPPRARRGDNKRARVDARADLRAQLRPHAGIERAARADAVGHRARIVRRGRTRRRGASRSAGAAPGAREKPNKRRRRSGAGGSHDGGGESALTHTSGGRMKMASLDDPCLFLGYFAPGGALMAERPWKEVLKRIPEPLYRHRFGT